MKYTIQILLVWALCLVPSMTQAQNCGETVTVESGETLYGIAQECGTSVSAMMAANDQITSRDLIRVGWTLQVPDGDEPEADQPESSPEADPAPRTDANYTVRAGDTMAEIAARYELTLGELLGANPHVVDPSIIDIGLELRIPGLGGDGRRPRTPDYDGRVTIHPNSGEPGTRVRVHASGFPPTAAVNVGAGPVASEYEILRSNVRTNANGGFVARTQLPENADPRSRWVFVVETDDHDVRGRSEPFDVEAEGRRDGGDEGRERVIVSGQLTGEGVECPAVRGQDGNLYTLAGDTGRFGEGDYVRVEGTVADVSICMQGTTINVSRIMVWKERAGDGQDDNGDENLRQVLRIEGMLAAGTECPVVRTDDGEVYSLTGETEGFEPGERVYVEGTRVDASICMEGTALSVRSIRSAE